MALGDLDSTFGSGGFVTTDFFGGEDHAYALITQRNDRITAIGNAGGFRNRFGLARYNQDGQLDTSFGSGGTTNETPNLITPLSANDALIQADGKVVVVGTEHFRPSMILARFNTNGTLDQSFDGGWVFEGWTQTQNTNTGASGSSIVLQADGKIVVAGGVYQTDPNPLTADRETFAAIRLNIDGSLDQSFGHDGRVGDLISGPSGSAEALVLQADGGIVLAGNSLVNGVWRIILTRYNTDGSLDTTFGTSGWVETLVGSASRVEDIVIQRDTKTWGWSEDKILVAGWTRNEITEDFLLVRYNTDGTIDQTFGEGGVTTTDFDGRDDIARALSVADDGTILVAGDTRANSDRQIALASYNANGSLDKTFGVGGKVRTSVRGSAASQANALAIQSPEKILVAGSSRGSSNNTDFLLARYKANLGTPAASISALVAYKGRVITAFSTDLIYLSPDARYLGGGGDTTRVYSGNTAVAMIPYDGLLTAFDNGEIYHSPDGHNLGGGGRTVRVYGPAQLVTAMTPYQRGVICAFTNGEIYKSPDSQNLGGGGNTELVYRGSQQALAMTTYQDGVLTAFSGGGIYFSPDGTNLGGSGGTVRVYGPGRKVAAMAPFKEGILTAFLDENIYFSPDGQNLGGGGNTEVVYERSFPTFGTPGKVVAMVPYRNGAITAFTRRAYFSSNVRELASGRNTVRIY
jgi:uncharacterized delta-60 repeat protein